VGVTTVYSDSRDLLQGQVAESGRERPFQALPKGDALDHISWRMSTSRPVRKLIGAKMPGLTASLFLADTFLHGEL